MKKLFLFLIAFLLFSASHFAQRIDTTPIVELTVNDMPSPFNSCEGEVVQIDLKVTPDTPFNTMTNMYGVRWVAVNEVTGRQQDIKQGQFDPDPDPSTPAINLFNLIRVAPRENTSYRAFVFGGPSIPPPGYVEFKVNVSKVPNSGNRKSVFTCNKTTIDLLAEIGGDPGGIWVPPLSAGGNIFTVGTDSPGAFNYTFPKSGPCPEISTTVTVKDCNNNDNDNDGIPDSVDEDDDNDGIPDSLESFCSTTQLVPSRFSLEEDFGIGGPQMNPNLNPILRYNVNIPQDISNDGEYNVATATYLRDSEGPGSGVFITTDKNPIPFSDGDGNVNGRYLAINPRTGAFPNTVYIYRQPDIPVVTGVQSRLSFQVTNLNTDNGSRTNPSLRIEIVGKSNTGGPDFIQTAATGRIDSEDIWIDASIDFIPPAGVSFVSLSVFNEQTNEGNGNDFGIDNIFLSTLECDFDFDGVPNALDLDSDNDGIYDIVETGNADKDTDGDGRYDGTVGANGVITGLVQGTLINSDGDMNADYLDIDSDNDGIVDNIEAQPTATYRAPSSIDGNVDGVDDAYNGLANRIIPITTISGVPDHINTNTDGDCMEDSVEAYDTNRNGVIDGAEKAPSASDSDFDGLLDSYDDVILDRLARYTNANNNGQTPDTFLNNHNPETNEKDWREPFADIIIDPVDVTDCTTTINLFDEIVNLFVDASVFPPTTGIWTTPSTTDLTGVPANLGTLDPSDSSYIDGDYVYTIPPFTGASACPEQKITLKVTIDNACKCPTITPPTEVSTGPYETCINATTLPTLEVTSSTNTDIVVRWFAEDGTTILEPNSVTFTPTSTDLKVGDTVFNAQFYDTVLMCESDFVEFNVAATAAPSAGVDPANPLSICASSMPAATISDSDLFSQLTGTVDSGGEWTSPSAVVLGATFTNVTPEAGVYTYTIESSGCEDDSQVTVELISIPTFSFGTTTCSVDKSSYSVDFNFAGNIADYNITSTAGTISRTATGGSITGIPSATDIDVVVTNTRLITCSLSVPRFTGVDCSCPTVAMPTNPSDETICEGDAIPTLSVSVASGLIANWLLPDGTPIAGAQNSLTYTPTETEPRDYIFTVVAEDASGCKSSGVAVNFKIIEKPKIVLPTENGGCEGEFKLPALSIGNYFTQPDGAGTQMNAGDPIMSTQTLYIFADNSEGTVMCSSQEEYTITIDPKPAPIAPAVDSSYCGSFTLPSLPANQQYFTGTDGEGTELLAGQDIETTQEIFILETSPQGCKGETSISIVIDDPNGSPGLDGTLEICISGEPKALFSSLNGSPSAGGIWMSPGGGNFGSSDMVMINPMTDPAGEYTYVIGANGACPTKEAIVTVTIDMEPVIVLPIVESKYCNSAPVPDYTEANQKYFTEADGMGQELIPGEVLEKTTTLFLRQTNGECAKDLPVEINIINLPTNVILPDVPSVCLDSAGDIVGVAPVISVPEILPASDYDFQWIFDGVAITSATGSSIDATALGQYQLQYTPKGLTCSNFTNIVSVDEKAKATIIALQKDIRKVTVIAEGEDLEYSINEGVFQTSNVFERVPFGDFTVEVRNSCNSDTRSDFLFGFPEFFTPNQDGDNDAWNVRGVKTKTIKISVFDRYGNLMAMFTPIDEGWDGKFKEIDMPGDDYWYYAVTISGEEFRGHFSLIR